MALVSAALLAASPHGDAQAADWLDNSLRGSFAPSSSIRWDGINLGVQAGLTSMDTDFGGSTGQQVAYILRNSTLQNEAQPSSWTALPHNITNSRNYGGFLGYSTQYDQLVLGLDAAYNRMSSAEAQASDTMTRIVTTSDTVQHTVTIAAQSSMKLIDYATARFRAGYAYGQFLPYAFVGGAVGRFNYTNTSTVTDIQNPGGTFGPVTQTDSKNNAVVGGFTAGLGIDVALLPNVFLRGEWEYVGFAQVSGIRSSINTGRIGIGMRF
jgi:opacity protein-like surface antigen